MAYEVTATRRRPQAFDALAGQEFVSETLKNTIESKKIAHAYLFSGPRGCGKTSTARILSKALNCESGPTATPCGKCPQCLEIARGASADVIEIDGASNTSVNDVRQIKEEVLFPPQSARYKIYIIDEVHMLSTSAFNALLKTIEEPPEYVVFIFATTELQKVPATIKSRCQQFNFRLVPIDTVEKLLEGAAEELGIRADEEALYWVARESTGSVRDAYTLFDQVAAFSGDHITYDKIRDKLGLVGVDRLNVIFEDCSGGRANDAILRLDGFLSQGVSIEQFISNCADYLRSLLLIKNGITKESLLGQSADRFSQAVLNSWGTVQIERAISIFLQLYRDIRYSISPRYELELAVSRLSWLSEYVSPVEVKRAIDQAKNLLLNSQAAPNVQALSGGQAQGGLSALMSPTAWRQNPISASAPQVPPPQGIQGANARPLPVLDALKNLPEYQNAPSVTESIQGRQIQNQPVQNQPIQGQAIQPQQMYSQPQRQYAPPQPQGVPEPPQEPPPASESAALDFRNIPDGGLQKAVTDFLALRDGVLAALLSGSRSWRKDGDKILIEVNSDFQKMEFEKNRPKILEAFSKIFSRRVDFQTELKVVEAADPTKDAPESVRLLLSTFRGEIIGVSDQTSVPQTEVQQTDEQNKSVEESDDEEQPEEIPIEEEDTDDE